MTKVFIDGKEGTTGLKIYNRLKERKDIELLLLNDEQRKDTLARSEMLNSCDIAFLCLPDNAAKEAVTLVKNPNVKIIDASTAHRTLKNWQYGFPEVFENGFEKIKNSNRVAVPGCHASGFIALVYPLIKAGILPKNAMLYCHSLTGYSGGGKKMIAQYEDPAKDNLLNAPRQYGITQNHKHLLEMTAITGLTTPPIFCPIVAPYFSGMLVTVPLFKNQLINNKTIDDIRQVYKSVYNKGLVKYNNQTEDFISSLKYEGLDTMEILLGGNNDRILLMARYDNLGKGASGAALECMNIMLNCNPYTGLKGV